MFLWTSFFLGLDVFCVEIHQSGLGDSLAVQDQLRKLFFFLLEYEKHQCQKMCRLPVLQPTIATVTAQQCKISSGHVQVAGAADTRRNSMTGGRPSWVHLYF